MGGMGVAATRNPPPTGAPCRRSSGERRRGVEYVPRITRKARSPGGGKGIPTSGCSCGFSVRQSQRIHISLTAARQASSMWPGPAPRCMSAGSTERRAAGVMRERRGRRWDGRRVFPREERVACTLARARTPAWSVASRNSCSGPKAFWAVSYDKGHEGCGRSAKGTPSAHMRTRQALR
jgi:hypothetical protein